MMFLKYQIKNILFFFIFFLNSDVRKKHIFIVNLIKGFFYPFSFHKMYYIKKKNKENIYHFFKMCILLKGFLKFRYFLWKKYINKQKEIFIFQIFFHIIMLMCKVTYKTVYYLKGHFFFFQVVRNGIEHKCVNRKFFK